MSYDLHSNASAPTATSTSLILRIQANEREAWSRFVYLYGPVLYSWCRKQRLQPADAKDLSQEILCQVLAKIGKYDRFGGSFRGWLRTMTRNKVIDFFRRRGRDVAAVGGTDHAIQIAKQADLQSGIDDPWDEDSQKASMADGVLRRALELLRSELEPTTIQAFVRMTTDGLTAKEVARELGWTGSTKADEAKGAKRVRMCKVRVLKRLREEFGEMIDLPGDGV